MRPRRDDEAVQRTARRSKEGIAHKCMLPEGKAILRVCFAFRPGSRVYTCGLKARIRITIALINLVEILFHKPLVSGLW